MFDLDEATEATKRAMEDPQVGDRFHEMYSWWMYVVKVDEDEVVTLSRGGSCTFPDDAVVRRFRCVHEFQDEYGYDTRAGYPFILADRGNDVEGWLDAADAHPE